MQQIATNDNESQQVAISTNVNFFLIREERTTNYPKEHFLNTEENLGEGILN